MLQEPAEQADKRMEMWSGAWRRCQAELQLLHSERDPRVLDCDPSSAERAQKG